MITLPVSGVAVRLRLPDGADEIAFAEGDRDAIAAALLLLARLAAPADGGPADWADLPQTDFEFLLLKLRELLLGGEIAAQVACSHCRERVEISFRVADYLNTIRSVMAPGVVAEAGGWFRLGGQKFRPPRVADVRAVRGAARPGAALRALCMAAGGGGARRAEAALARLAPEVTGPVGGACPGCGRAVTALFDVAAYVVAEFRRLTGTVHAEVHLLAAAHGWAEAAILALPGARRRIYAGYARDAGAGA